MVLLGAWGALIPFVGPYFDYAFTPEQDVDVDGRALLAGGPAWGSRIPRRSHPADDGHRVVAWIGAWLGIAAGAWFVVGPLLAPLWRANYLGSPVGDRTDVAVEQIGMFYGLGAAIILLAAMAAGRFSVVGIRDVALAPAHTERVARLTTSPSSSRSRPPSRGPWKTPVSCTLRSAPPSR